MADLVTKTPVPQGDLVASTPLPETTTVDPVERDIEVTQQTRSPFARGVRMGFNQLGGMAHGLAGNIAETMGLTDFANTRFADAEQYVSFADAVGPDVKDYRQVKDFATLARYVTGLGGQAAAMFTPAIAGMGVGAAVGGGLRGAFAGGLAGSAVPNAGEQALRLRGEPGDSTPGDRTANALAVGGVNAALDMLLPGAAAARMARPALRTGSLPGAVAKGAATEGLTEGAQELVGQTGHTALVPGRDREEDTPELINSIIAGTVGGAGFSGVARAGEMGMDGLRKVLGSRRRPTDEDDLSDVLARDDVTEKDLVDEIGRREEATDEELRAAFPDEDFSKDPMKREELKERLREKHDAEVEAPRRRSAMDDIGRAADEARGDEPGKAKKSLQRTAIDAEILRNMLEKMDPKVAERLSGEERMELAGYLKDFAMHGFGKRSEVEGPGAPREGAALTEFPDDELRPSYTREGDRETVLEEVPAGLVSFFGRDTTKRVQETSDILSQGGIAKPRQFDDKPLAQTARRARERFTRIESVIDRHLKTDIFTKPADRRTAIDGFQDLLGNTAPGHRELLMEAAGHMFKDRPKAMEEIDEALRNERPMVHLSREEAEGLADLIDEDADTVEYNPSEGPYEDPRLGVHDTLEEALAKAKAIEADGYDPKAVRFEVHEQLDVVGGEVKPTGKYIVEAKDAEGTDALSKSAWQSIRNRGGQSGFENGVITVTTVDKPAGIPISIPRLTAYAARTASAQESDVDSRIPYQANMVLRGLGMLLGDANFKGFGKKTKEELGSDPAQWDIPDETVVGRFKGKFYTWADIKAMLKVDPDKMARDRLAERPEEAAMLSESVDDIQLTILPWVEDKAEKLKERRDATKGAPRRLKFKAEMSKGSKEWNAADRDYQRMVKAKERIEEEIARREVEGDAPFGALGASNVDAKIEQRDLGKNEKERNVQEETGLPVRGQPGPSNKRGFLPHETGITDEARAPGPVWSKQADALAAIAALGPDEGWQLAAAKQVRPSATKLQDLNIEQLRQVYSMLKKMVDEAPLTQTSQELIDEATPRAEPDPKPEAMSPLAREVESFSIDKYHQMARVTAGGMGKYNNTTAVMQEAVGLVGESALQELVASYNKKHAEYIKGNPDPYSGLSSEVTEASKVETVARAVVGMSKYPPAGMDKWPEAKPEAKVEPKVEPKAEPTGDVLTLEQEGLYRAAKELVGEETARALIDALRRDEAMVASGRLPERQANEAGGRKGTMKRLLERGGDPEYKKGQLRNLVDTFARAQAEWASRKFTDMRARGLEPLTDQQKKDIRAYIERVLGKEGVKTAFKNLAHAGEFELDGILEKIRISNWAADGMGAARHEALHALFSRLTKADKRAAAELLAAAGAPVVVQRLRELLKDHPEALKQLKDPEERLAYMYQFWASNELDIGPRTKTWFDKVKNVLRALAAFWSEQANDLMNVARAEALFELFDRGDLSNKNTVAEVLRTKRPKIAFDAATEVMGPAWEWFTKAAYTSDGFVRSMNIAALTDVAGKFLTPLGKQGQEPGYLQDKHTVANRFLSPMFAAMEGSTAEERRIAIEAMQSDTAVRAGKPHQIVMAVKRSLREAYEYMEKSGVKAVVWNDQTKKYDELDIKWVANYFPRVYNKEYIFNNRKAFVDMLVKNGMSNSDATQAYENIMRPQAATDETDAQVGLTYYAPQTLERKIDVPADQLAPFLAKDLESTMATYLSNVARRGEYARRFGNQGQEIGKAVEEAVKQGATPEQVRDFNRAVQAWEGTIGHQINPKLKAMFGAAVTYQNYRLLPLALFSSLVDPLGIAVRGGGPAEAFRAFARGVRDLGAQGRDDGTDLAEAVGAIARATEQHMIADAYGSQYMGQWQQRANRLFFKWNGMESWNRSMRIQATVAAEKFIIRHFQQPNDHSARYLRELNLDESDIRVVDGHLVLNDKVKQAINLWVDGAILRPHAGIRPIWMSDPHWMLVSHLKQFTYSFQRTIIARTVHEMENGNFTPAFALLSYVPAMIAADVARAMLTPGGGDDEALEKLGLGGIIGRGVQRAGLFGPGEYALNAYGDMGFGKPPLVSFAGPTLQQSYDMLSAAAGRGNMDNELARAIPGYVFVK